jgi:hypothetical protein
VCAPFSLPFSEQLANNERMRVLFFLKISAMVFALVVVFYAMRYLKSRDFVEQSKNPDSTLGLLLGTSEVKPFNWCPEKVQRVQILVPPQNITDTRELIGLCQVMMEPVLKTDADVADYHVVATAGAATGPEKKLERNSKGVFRVEGLPFRSKFLEQSLH